MIGQWLQVPASWLGVSVVGLLLIIVIIILLIKGD